jgi:hypothetical protein
MQKAQHYSRFHHQPSHAAFVRKGVARHSCKAFQHGPGIGPLPASEQTAGHNTSPLQNKVKLNQFLDVWKIAYF